MPSSSTPEKRPRGRPARPEAEVRHALLQHTMQLLLEQGYEATTMEAVAARAGVAKKTVYRHADNRDALVGLAVRAWGDNFAPQLQRDAARAAEVLPLLRDILKSICTQVLSDPAVRLFRLLTGDFPGKPDLLRNYQDNGIERGRALLGQWLARQQRQGFIRTGDAHTMAVLILAMAVAEPLRQHALGLAATDIDAHLDAALGLLAPGLLDASASAQRLL